MKKLYVIGDSISMHYGVHLEKMIGGFWDYRRKTAEDADRVGVDPNANGGDSSRVLDFLTAIRKNPNFDPDLFLINAGLHDIKKDLATEKMQIGSENYRDNLLKIVETVNDWSKSMIWIRTTHVSEPIHNRPNMQFHRFSEDQKFYNTLADEVMTKMDVPIIDLYTFTKNLGEDQALFVDHVHFSESVRQLQSAFIAGYLSKLEKWN